MVEWEMIQTLRDTANNGTQKQVADLIMAYDLEHPAVLDVALNSFMLSSLNVKAHPEAAKKLSQHIPIPESGLNTFLRHSYLNELIHNINKNL